MKIRANLKWRHRKPELKFFIWSHKFDKTLKYDLGVLAIGPIVFGWCIVGKMVIE